MCNGVQAQNRILIKVLNKLGCVCLTDFDNRFVAERAQEVTFEFVRWNIRQRIHYSQFQ